MEKELVIAAYERNYKDWTKFINDDIRLTVYRKGENKNDPNEIYLENNIGQDVHTFFSHIVKRYDHLYDYTMFCQDFPFDHVRNVIELINSNPNYWNMATNTINDYGYYPFSTATALNWEFPMPEEAYTGKTLICKANGSPHHRPSTLQLDTLWPLIFNDPIPERFEFVPSGHFIASKQCILKRSKEFYQNIVSLLETRNECPYEIERLETYIFNPNIK